jgi:dipeptidyl aminopeptidase/acylaminoacyl peptidase
MSPQFLPVGAGRRVLLYTVGFPEITMLVQDLETGDRQELGPGDLPFYSSTGHIVYQSGGDAGPGLEGLSIWARPFSLETLRPTGAAFPIAEVGRYPTAADDGTLVYVGSGSTPLQQLVWRDRSGALLETGGQTQTIINSPSLSPDGRRVAVSSTESGNPDIWVHDLIRSTKTRLTFDEAPERTPTWSPSGEQIVYWLNGADGADGRYLVYQENAGPETRSDIRYVELEADGSASEPVAFLATPADEQTPKLSPDGRFVAYTSDESGRGEVYVRPFPEGAGRWQASVDGGTRPRWSRNGRELYYVSGADALMSVPVSTGQGVALGRPQELFRSDDLISNTSSVTYDISGDGQRFITIARVEQDAEEAPPKIRIVQNWFEEFRNRQR